MFNSGNSSIDISASGLAAERYRMEVIANNIANAGSTRSAEGGPYRRQQVIFAAGDTTHSRAGDGLNQLNGVEVYGITQDQSELPLVFNPGHPDANDQGMVAMPNVKVPYEMVDMITASRSYEANLRSIKSFQQMVRQTLTILRGTG